MVAAAAAPDLSGLPLAWQGPLRPSDKISPLLEGGSAAAPLAIFHDDLEPSKIAEIVRSLGFDIVPNPGLLPGQLVITRPVGRLPELSRFDEVAYPLPASADRAAGSRLRGCGHRSRADRRVRPYRNWLVERCVRECTGPVLYPYPDRKARRQYVTCGNRADSERVDPLR